MDFKRFRNFESELTNMWFDVFLEVLTLSELKNFSIAVLSVLFVFKTLPGLQKMRRKRIEVIAHVEKILE